MHRYTATKGRECVQCIFDNPVDMALTMARHIAMGFKIN